MMIAFNPAFSESVGLKLAEIQQELTLHFLHGLVNAKGHKLIKKYQEERNKQLQK
jgi:hypothetical protein